MYLCKKSNNELQFNKYCTEKSINFKLYAHNKMQ